MFLENPKASAASLFNGGFGENSNLSQFNQFEFSSFVNEGPPSPAQTGPMSLPLQQTIAPPVRSGPPSLDGKSVSLNLIKLLFITIILLFVYLFIYLFYIHVVLLLS